jgi:hypothetical protein
VITAHHRRLALVASAVFLLLAVWSITVPLFASPDENAHYIKSAAVVRGVLIGESRVPSVAEAYWSTDVDIDVQFNAANWVPWCFAPDPAQPACARPVQETDPRQEIPFTTMGRYPPLAYVAPGLATFLGPNDVSVRVARLLNAVVASTLVAMAWGALERRGRSGIPVLLAFTPGAVFLASTINPSGIEIAAAVGSWVLVYCALTGPPMPLFERAALGVSLVLLTAARPIGPLLTLLVVTTVALATGTTPRSAWQRIRTHWLVSIVTVSSAAFMAIWYLIVFSAATSSSVTANQPTIGRVAALSIALGHLPGLVAEAVGNFGWLDTPTPTLARGALLGAVLMVVAQAWDQTPHRVRLAVFGVLVVTATLSVVLDLNYYRLLGNFGGQGRHLLPLLVGIPVLSAWYWSPKRRAEVAVAVTWGTAVTTCGLFAVRRYSVGVTDGNFWEMVGSPVWTPPLGIGLSFLAIAASSGLVVVAMLGRPGDRHQRTSDTKEHRPVRVTAAD